MGNHLELSGKSILGFMEKMPKCNYYRMKKNVDEILSSQSKPDLEITVGGMGSIQNCVFNIYSENVYLDILDFLKHLRKHFLMKYKTFGDIQLILLT